MKIEVYADIISVPLEVLRTTDVVTECGGFVIGTVGNGSTPEEAIRAYARKVAGKRIKCGRNGDAQYYNVPHGVE